MPKITFVQPDGNVSTLDVPVGVSIMQAAINHGVAGIVAECGGSLACASCHVYIEPRQPGGERHA